MKVCYNLQHMYFIRKPDTNNQEVNGQVSGYL